MAEEKEVISYCLSCDNWGDGKSVCLWRSCRCEQVKIARFQCDEAARLFAEEFGFPLSDNVAKRLNSLEDKG
jgi:hypothetical protein